MLEGHLPFRDCFSEAAGHAFDHSASFGRQHHLRDKKRALLSSLGDGRLKEQNQFFRVCGVGPGRWHHLPGPEEGHLQSHGTVVEDQHLVVLLPQVMQTHFLRKNRGAHFIPIDVFQHLDQFFMVVFLHPVKMIEVQEHDLLPVVCEERIDLLEALIDFGTEQTMSEVEFIVGVSGLGGDSEIKITDPGS